MTPHYKWQLRPFNEIRITLQTTMKAATLRLREAKKESDEQKVAELRKQFEGISRSLDALARAEEQLRDIISSLEGT